MRNAELDEAQAGIKIARRNINNLRYADDTTLMGFKKLARKKISGDRRKKKSMMLKSISRKKPGLALRTMEAPRPWDRGDAGNHRRTFLALSSQFPI